MVKKVLPFAKKYGVYAILSPIAIIGEVWAEINIPKLMSQIVDTGIGNKDISYVLKVGGQMVWGSAASCGGGFSISSRPIRSKTWTGSGRLRW